MILLAFTTVNAQDDAPMYEKVAFDRLFMVPEAGSGVFEVFPIRFPGDIKPNSLPKTGEIIIRFVELPADEYAVNWSAIDKVETFSEIVFVEMMNKQTSLIDRVNNLPQNDADSDRKLKTQLTELYGYYNFFFNSSTKPVGLANLYRRYLLGEAVYYLKIKDWANSVTRLERLYAEQKDYPGLADTWSKVLAETLTDSTNKGNYRQARALIRYFDNYFPNHPVVVRWTQAYINRAKSLLAESQQALENQDYPNAFRKCNEAINVYPKLAGLREYAEKLHNTVPQVIVGVTNPASTVKPDAPFNVEQILLPGRIRQTRLLQRSLMEQTGFVVEGGKYRTPLGNYEKESNGTVIRITIDPNFDPPPSPAVIAESLFRFVDNKRNESSHIWNGFFDAIEIDDVNRFTIRLKRRNVLPESMLRVPIRISSASEADGSYTVLNQDSKESVFIANGMKPASYVGPRIIVEKHIIDTKIALQQLSTGQIAAIDRVAPWEIESTDVAQRYTVGKYTFPTIHFLVPNLNKPLTSSRTFRRGLLYGLNRQWVVSQIAVTQNDIEIISGPSAIGNSESDPLAYGYDRSILPRVYDPKLAAALCLMSLTQARDKNQLSKDDLPKNKRDNPIAEDMPELVLAHPDNTTSQTACYYIMRQWEAIGIPVRLVSYRPDERIGRGTEVDFWYVPCQISEPMFDVRAILGDSGLVGGGSAYMSLALEKLRVAEDWPTIAEEMRAIHRWCYEETTILPLWQWKDRYIVRKNIGNFTESGNEIHNFYQNVENWTTPFFWDDILE